MYLNIILTILVVVLITMTVLLVRWWRNFGKGIFQSVGKLKNMGTTFPSQDSPLMKMKEMTDKLNKMSQMTSQMTNNVNNMKR